MKEVHEADIACRLELIFTELMPEETVPVGQRARGTCASWDSLFQLNLVMAIEQEFGIILTVDDAIELSSFASAMQMLRDKYQ